MTTTGSPHACGGDDEPAPDGVDPALHEVMASVSQGCPRSFALLYRLTRHQMQRIVARMVREPAEAEEVLQEAFLRVWDKAARFDPGKGGTLAWIATICRNAAIDHLRRCAARPHLRSPSAAHDDIDPYAGLRSALPEPPDLLMAAQAAQAVQDCLRSLCDESREYLTLAFYRDLSHAEMASALGQPLGSVKSRIRRSMQGMRASLAVHGPPAQGT